MSETVSPENSAERGRFARLTDNPVTLKELRSRMRGAKAFLVLTLYLVVTSFFILFIYLIAMSEGGTSANRNSGQAVFYSLLGLQVVMVAFITPAFTAGAVSGERERQTFELLRTTLLSAPDFVLGKLISALSYVFLLLFSTLPLISLAFLLGGVSLIEVVTSQLLLAVAATAVALLGLYNSTITKTTLAASVTTYGMVLFILAGLPLIAGLAAAVLSPLFISMPSFWEDVVIYIGLIGSTTNFPISLLITELMWNEEGAVFGFWDGSTWYFSPWYVSILVHLFFGWILYRLTVRRLRRVSQT